MCVDLNGVARAYWAAESHLVDAGVEGGTALYFFFDECAACLAHHFAEDYSWYYRIAREVALYKEFFTRYMVVGYSLTIYQFCIVDEQHWLAMWHELL